MASSPELGHLISLAREFRTLVRQKAADRLDGVAPIDVEEEEAALPALSR
jgi:hypothetical protein